MGDEREASGINQRNDREAYVAMRSMDRKIFYSPTDKAPDFFTFPIAHESLPLESRVIGGMRTHFGVIANNDHQLTLPNGESKNAVAYATYLRYTVDREKAQDWGYFNSHDIRAMRHDLLQWSDDDTTFTPEERRSFRIRAFLFNQVITLFDGRTLR